MAQAAGLVQDSEPANFCLVGCGPAVEFEARLAQQTSVKNLAICRPSDYPKKEMARYHPPPPTHLCLLILLIIIPSSRGLLNGTELLKEVCNHTSNYTFCVATLNTDPNAGGPQALAGDLANTALRFAQTKACDAQSLIAFLLKNATTLVDRNRLQICQISNNKAISELSSANNDFNSDSLDTMVEEMNSAAYATKDCQKEIQGRGTHFSLLATINADLIKLCEICIVSTRYFTLEDFY